MKKIMGKCRLLSILESMNLGEKERFRLQLPIIGRFFLKNVRNDAILKDILYLEREEGENDYETDRRLCS